MSIETFETSPDVIGAPTADVPDNSTSSVVVTGFEPFEGRTRNRSWDLVDRLELAEGQIRHCLPVDFVRVREMVLGILSHRPRAVLMIGEAPTSEVLVEQIAVNVADADRPDNAGRMPQDQPLIEEAPLALRAGWNGRSLAGLMHQEDIPAIVSFHAGTFVCNAALYFALHQAARGAELEGRRPAPAIGFLHVPNSRGTAGLRSTNLARAVELAIDELLRSVELEASSSRAPEAHG